MSNQTITRAEVTDKIVSEVGLTRQESSDLLDRTLDMIGAALEHEDEVMGDIILGVTPLLTFLSIK